ncbi:MAG: hypothetical protein ACO1OT_18515 [Heyndrickxia sp.]
MKKLILTILSAVLLLGLNACSNQNRKSQSVININEQGEKVFKENDVREIVWKQLSLEQKEWIDGTWKEGKISKITLKENMMSQVVDKSYEGKEVYLIDFPTKSKSTPNNMVVYADRDTLDYIGNGLVD